LSIKTDAVLTVSVHRTVIGTPHATIFRIFRRWHESVNALAIRLTIYDLAKRVGTARILARINAAMFMTDEMHRTIFGTGTVSFRLTTIHVRIAHVIRRALTHRIVRWTGDAECSGMTRVRMACLHSDAFDVGYWVWAKSGRALAYRFVVIRDADRVHTARVFVAGVIAGVCESIAELRRRAVDVVDAGHRMTPGCRVVRIAGILPRWTFTIRYVIVDDTERVGTTSDEVADQLTSEWTV